jgi:hypothetical protein
MCFESVPIVFQLLLGVKNLASYDSHQYEDRGDDGNEYSHAALARVFKRRSRISK